MAEVELIEEPLSCFDDLKEGIFIPRWMLDYALKTLRWDIAQLMRGELPPPFDEVTRKRGLREALKSLQLGIVSSRTSWWCSFFLRNPTDPDKPWVYWPYQVESADYEGHTLHECGAEVGKTLDIVGVATKKAYTTPNGSGLITAARDGHLRQIIRKINQQLLHNPALAAARVEYTKAPYTYMRFDNGFELDIIPAGFDGESLRSVHASTFVMMDEAAKAKNPQIFEELWGRGKPGAVFRIYSTPDGDRGSPFFKLCAQADGALQEDDRDDSVGDVEFKKFHWSKELMPPPFWTEKRRRFFINKFGGEDSPRYQRVVFGNWGDPENSVFPWFQFKRLLKDIPEYRCLKIMVDDAQGMVMLEGYRLEPKVSGNVQGKPEKVLLLDQRVALSGFNIVDTVKQFFTHIPGVVHGGVDFGYSQDPTEILIKLIYGSTHRVVARLQFKNMKYDWQDAAINAMDDIYDAGKMKMFWGGDPGNAGSAVLHNLQGDHKYPEKDFKSRFIGYNFANMFDNVDERGELTIDKMTGKPDRLPAKDLATDLLVTKMQRGELEYPYDEDICLFYPNHTYREGPRHRVFRKEDDHIIDADRVCTLSVVLPGNQKKELLACGAR